MKISEIAANVLKDQIEELPGGYVSSCTIHVRKGEATASYSVHKNEFEGMNFTTHYKKDPESVIYDSLELDYGNIPDPCVVSDGAALIADEKDIKSYVCIHLNSNIEEVDTKDPSDTPPHPFINILHYN